MKYSKAVENYFSKNAIEAKNTTYMILSPDGVVLDVGNMADMVVVNPIVGELVDDFMPALHGLFPLQHDLYLPNIQLSPDRFFHLHVIGENETYWLVAHETTVRVSMFRNEFDRLIYKDQNDLKILNGMGYFVFSQNESGNCYAIADPPEWAGGLVNESSSAENVCLIEIFPYMEGFIAMLPEYEPGDRFVKKYAGIWSQTLPNSTEINLQAWALQRKNEMYILIGEVEEADNKEQLIQKARENSLAYEQLQKTRDRLQTMVKLKEQFVNIISHDYRSPISTLIDGVSFLKEVFEESGKIDTSELARIDQVKLELTRLLEYNNKLYNWTQLNLDTIELNLENVPLRMIIDTAKEHFSKRLKEKNISFQSSVEPNAMVNTDYVLLSQVIFNLIDNAIKFSHKDNGIEVEATSDFVKIADFGVGMENSMMEEIKRGDILKSERGTKGERGTGLGLSIVSRIVQTLNFTMNITSVKGKGTEIKILFKEPI